jgi:hypothetical protein
VLLDALLNGSACYWERRAHQLEAAIHRPGDYTGRATTADLERRCRDLAAAAAACRHKVALLDADEYGDLLDQVLSDSDGAAA